MSFTFKPAIDNGVLFQELPRPILRFRVQDAWDYKQFKVPLKDGDTLVGQSQQGIDISIEGQIGSQSGALKLSEAEMFDALENLRAALNVDGTDGKYDLFLYHDASSATYRKFQACTTVRFEYDLSEKAIFTYSVTIHAEDPGIYSTAPSV